MWLALLEHAVGVGIQAIHDRNHMFGSEGRTVEV